MQEQIDVQYEKARDRVGTFDANGRRISIYPAQVRGWFRRRRTLVELVLLATFLTLPLISVGGHPTVFLNVARREFHLFGFHFWATDTPLFFFVLATFFCLLMAVTALWGRVWCGWACPQTVMIDLIYRRIEEWIEGDSRERRLLEAAPMSGWKLAKKLCKWLSYVALSIALAHAFLAYFVSWAGWSERYATGFAQASGSLLMLILLSLIFLFDFGWFREQFCIVACPYGRWQSVWLDEKSMVVGYDAYRGEPRRGQVGFGERAGDCVNCLRCIQVCPTGIDIRRGVQMECIACTACIDTCDEVMLALGKKPGLVRYTTQALLTSATRSSRSFSVVWRARPISYLGVVAALLAGFAYSQLYREPLWVAVHRPPGPPYLSSTLSDGSREIVNPLRVSIRNQLSKPVRLTIEIGSTGATPLNGLTLTGETSEQFFQPGEKKDLMVFAKLKSAPGETAVLRIDAKLQLILDLPASSPSTLPTKESSELMTRDFRFLTP